jgi:hypothetical protein
LEITSTNSIIETEEEMISSSSSSSSHAWDGGYAMPEFLFALDDDVEIWEGGGYDDSDRGQSSHSRHTHISSTTAKTTTRTAQIGCDDDVDAGGDRNGIIDPRRMLPSSSYDDCIAGTDDTIDDNDMRIDGALGGCVDGESEWTSGTEMSTGDDGSDASPSSGGFISPHDESRRVEMTLLNMDATKEREEGSSPGSRVNVPPACRGVVRSRVGDIQQRVDVPVTMASSEGGDSQRQRHKHPRVRITSPHRSIPIGIAKTYSKRKCSSSTTGNDYVRTSLRF